MAKSALCLEEIQIHPITPAYVVDDADDDTVDTGDYISLKNYGKVLILWAFSDGTATSGDIDIEVYQSTNVANSPADAKALDICKTGRIYSKLHATTLAAVGQWTKETQASADEIYDDEASGEQIGMIGIEVRADDLDVTGGFNCIRVDLDEITTEKLVCGLYILMDPKYPAAPERMLSALAD